MPLFRNRRLALEITAVLLFSVAATMGINYAVRAYILNRAEQNVQNLILSHRGLHDYIQKVMHPTFFKAVADGEIAQTYYAPEIFSSSFIVRVMHDFYNEELLKYDRQKIYYKLAAENPRNPVNKADDAETRLIARFNQSPELKYVSEVVEVDGKKYLYYAITFLRNTAACMQCHGRRQDAPLGLQARYPGEGGFNEQIGHIRAIESIRAPLRQDLGVIEMILLVVIGTALALSFLFLFNKKLRGDVQSKTRRLEQELLDREKTETELRQRTEALQQSETRYRNLVETSTDWVWETDTQARYTYASPRVRELLGYTPEEVLGSRPFDLMSKAEAERVQRFTHEAVAAHQPFMLEHQMLRKDGRLLVIETSGVPRFSTDGAWLGYCGMDRDITSRREAEKHLRLQGAALEAAANAIVITDRNGTIEWANPAFTTLSGWSLAEAAGKNPRDLVKSGEHDAAFYGQMWEIILAGKVWRGEIVNRRKDGAHRTEEMTITPVRNERGEIDHFIAIKQDITDQKAMETHFLQAQRIDAIGTLAGGIAHDLNNILTPILMVTSVLKKKVSDDADRELLAITESSAQRGAEIIRQLLTFSRGQNGERSAVQARHLINEMGRLMRETFPRDIDIRMKSPTDLWTVVADPTQLHQVLMNLCVNARDAMPTGGHLTITAANATFAEGEPTLPPDAKPGPYVTIFVSDTGHGIPPEIRHRIFDPFFTTKPIGKGTGLGLSTVLGIVRNHGGFIHLDSTSTAGTTFKIYLPAIPDGVEAVVSLPEIVASPSIDRKTIMLVDDERCVRDTMRVFLERQHYLVVTAGNGKDALAQYLRHGTSISLLVTDLMMPVMDGLTLIRTLRAIDPNLKIIPMSGLTEVIQTEELHALGVSDLLIKPFEGSVLLSTITRLLP